MNRIEHNCSRPPYNVTQTLDQIVCMLFEALITKGHAPELIHRSGGMDPN